MLGRSSLEEFLGENGRSPFSAKARGRFWLRLEREREIQGYESEWLRSDGSRVYLREHARAIRGPDQEVLWYEGTLEDISDRRAAEKQIQAERDFTSAVIDAAATLVVILDREGCVVRFNQACEALSGYSLHEVAGRPLWEILSPPDERDKVRECYKKLTAGEFPGKHECSWLVKSGNLRRIEWSDSALLDEHGGIRNAISMGIDVTERRAIEDALRQSESRYRELFESASDVIYRMTVDGRILQVNAAAERLTGYSRDQIHHQAQFLTPEYWAASTQRLEAKLKGTPSSQFELPIKTASGNTVYLDLRATVSYENGQPVEILGIGRDITWRKLSEEFERGRRTILEMAARYEPLPAVMQKLRQLLEAQFPESRCTIDVIPVAPGSLPPSGAGAKPVYEPIEPGSPEFDCGYRMKWRMPVLSNGNGQLAFITLATSRIQSPTAQESDRLATAVKLAALTIEHRMMTEGGQWNAQHDKLTGLANRELFEQRVQQAIDSSTDRNQPFAIFYADLDRFKIINDTLGQEVGDSLLNAVAERLSRRVAGRGLVARMGGDEFTVLINPVWNRQEADSLARLLLSCFETAFDAGGQELFVSASIGCSMYPWDGEDVQTLRRNADTAMYRAKGSGRNRFLQFAPVMISGLERRLKIQNELHRALERGELNLFYQPQHDLKDDRMIGVEALLRWTSRDLGAVSAGEFIPVAEESGLIVEIGTWVLKEACQQCRRWYDGGHPLRVAVNVSAWQFARPDFVETVQNVLCETGISAELLELELTETVLMQGCGEARVDLERLRQMGVQVSIDDFGTGYSSLAYLQHLPIHSLKIDLSFVRSISEDEKIPPLIRAITALAHGLNIDVIAEGVERHYQARVLRRAGCDRVQGYLYGRPVPADELTRLLKTDCRPSVIANGLN
jgi:diguanylate cyclase (GGDEF)-like protein/PAS domain S-box-containing protein